MRLATLLSRRLLVFVILGSLAAWAAIPAAAQTSTVPDMTQFGFPRVTGTANFTPGQAATITAGNQTVVIPADFLSKPVKFEFLEGDPSFFTPNLEADDQGKSVQATFAFRVTDTSNGQLIGKFDKPVLWSVTGSDITSDSEVYNTSPANPPKITSNSTPGTLQGTTLSHSFGGAGVGWLVLGPPSVVGMPTTGAGAENALANLLPLALLGGIVVLGSGITLRRKAKRTV